MPHDAIHLARIAWHIGNRHLAAEISDQPPSASAPIMSSPPWSKAWAVLCTSIQAPFNPEGGAYGGSRPARIMRHIPWPRS